MKLDTSGAVYSAKHPTESLSWDDLSPFTQGYVEALFASSVDQRGRMMAPRDGRYASAPRERRPVAFSDLAPETLARIIADCEEDQVYDEDPNDGKQFWEDRQKGALPNFPTLTVTLGDDGKVRFA